MFSYLTSTHGAKDQDMLLSGTFGRSSTQRHAAAAFVLHLPEDTRAIPSRTCDPPRNRPSLSISRHCTLRRQCLHSADVRPLPWHLPSSTSGSSTGSSVMCTIDPRPLVRKCQVTNTREGMAASARYSQARQAAEDGVQNGTVCTSCRTVRCA